MGRIVWAVCNVTSGTSISNLLKMIPNLGGILCQWTINILRKCVLIHENFCLTEVGICKSSGHTILTEKLKMHCVATKLMLCLLTNEWKENGVTVGEELFGYEVETEVQSSSSWVGKSLPWPKNACRSHSNVKEILSFFFYWKGITHHEFVPCGQSQ